MICGATARTPDGLFGKRRKKFLTMSKVQTLRAIVTQRLTAAADEIFELFQRTIAEYEEEVWRQRKLLDAVFKPELRLHTAGLCPLWLFSTFFPPCVCIQVSGRDKTQTFIQLMGRRAGKSNFTHRFKIALPISRDAVDQSNKALLSVTLKSFR